MIISEHFPLFSVGKSETQIIPWTMMGLVESVRVKTCFKISCAQIRLIFDGSTGSVCKKRLFVSVVSASYGLFL